MCSYNVCIVVNCCRQSTSSKEQTMYEVMRAKFTASPSDLGVSEKFALCQSQTDSAHCQKPETPPYQPVVNSFQSVVHVPSPAKKLDQIGQHKACVYVYMFMCVYMCACLSVHMCLLKLVDITGILMFIVLWIYLILHYFKEWIKEDDWAVGCRHYQLWNKNDDRNQWYETSCKNPLHIEVCKKICVLWRDTKDRLIGLIKPRWSHKWETGSLINVLTVYFSTIYFPRWYNACQNMDILSF